MDANGSEKKSAMALALERLRAKKRNSNGIPLPVTNGSISPQQPEIPAPIGPVITASFSTAQIPQPVPVPNVPTATQVQRIHTPPHNGLGLLSTQNITMNFVFACNIVFKIPVTENRVLADKEYVVYAFNFGAYFFPGNDVVAEHRKNLYNGTEFKARFLHDDPKRKSYNKVEVILSGKPVTLFKPESAVTVLRLILCDKAFFVQDSALSRVDGFYRAQFPNSSFIYYAKLLLDQEIDKLRAQALATDCALLLKRVEQTRAEMCDIQVVDKPNKTSGVSATVSKESLPPPAATIAAPTAPPQHLKEPSAQASTKPKPSSAPQDVVDVSNANQIDIKEEPLEERSAATGTFSNYDPKKSKLISKEEINQWFLCKDCIPFKIISEKDDSMETHCSEYPDHYQIYPDWYFAKFDLKIKDLKFEKPYASLLK